jgi:hypothetical protein
MRSAVQFIQSSRNARVMMRAQQVETSAHMWRESFAGFTFSYILAKKSSELSSPAPTSPNHTHTLDSVVNDENVFAVSTAIEYFLRN